MVSLMIMRKKASRAEKGSPILLKNGLIADGTGNKAWTGNVLIKGSRIEKVSEKEIAIQCKTIDCRGKVITPGFIDMHSHNDWFLPSKGNVDLKTPFTLQGITTFVGGNCGFSPAGLKKDTRHIPLIEKLFKGANDGIRWKSMEEYFSCLKKIGMTHNLINLAGHGTTRTSIKGSDTSVLTKEEMGEMLYLLEEAMEQGAQGVSLGLGYEPGLFAPINELARVALLVRKKNKVLTVHARAFTALSGAYPLRPFGKPHNLLALQELIDLARVTGVKLQLSHLIFVGGKSWNTFHRALSIIDKAIYQGVDVKFDLYSFLCGASIISVVLPPWFLRRIPAVFDNKKAVTRLALEFKLMTKLLGFGFEDIQIAHANHPDLDQFNGMFLSDIARKRGMSPVENYLDFVRKSEGTARILLHRYSNNEIVQELMKHPASLFMTDAWVELSGLQNPSAFASFPRFLQLAREKSLISLEEAVHKMTGASASRFNISGRGILKKGMPADITVFNWKEVRDNTSDGKAGAGANGIEEVFINGMHVVKKGKINTSLRPGSVVLN
jgi:N-acyl-D-amino-acid deacylase